jgi:hypothetical protein
LEAFRYNGTLGSEGQGYKFFVCDCKKKQRNSSAAVECTLTGTLNRKDGDVAPAILGFVTGCNRMASFRETWQWLKFPQNGLGVLSVLLYGSETWTVKASDARRITAAEMKYMRRTAGYTWDRLQNKCTDCKGANHWNTRETGYNM